MTTPTWEEALAAGIVSEEDEATQLASAYMDNEAIRPTIRAEAFLSVVTAYSEAPRWRFRYRSALRKLLMRLGLEEAGLA